MQGRRIVFSNYVVVVLRKSDRGFGNGPRWGRGWGGGGPERLNSVDEVCVGVSPTERLACGAARFCLTGWPWNSGIIIGGDAIRHHCGLIVRRAGVGFSLSATEWPRIP